jgi:hypothetical protein
MDSNYPMPRESVLACITIESLPLTEINNGVQKVIVNATLDGSNISNGTHMGAIVSHVESFLHMKQSEFTNLELITYNSTTRLGIPVLNNIIALKGNVQSIPLGIIPSVFENGINSKELCMHFSKRG